MVKCLWVHYPILVGGKEEEKESGKWLVLLIVLEVQGIGIHIKFDSDEDLMTNGITMVGAGIKRRDHISHRKPKKLGSD